MTGSTLTLLLAGPLQSWGESSRHMTRSTLTHPSKSGVLGILAAALGRTRGQDLSDLAALQFGVRIDQPGQLLTDFHTISGASHAPLEPAMQRLPTADGGTLRRGESTKVTRRYYLADARFVAALVGDSSLLSQTWDKLARPCFPLYLGRRSCPPALPVRLRLWPETTMNEALTRTPWMAADHVTRRHRETEVQLRAVIEDAHDGEVFNDQPVAPFRQSFSPRLGRHSTITVAVPGRDSPGGQAGEPARPDTHDPFDLLPG